MNSAITFALLLVCTLAYHVQNTPAVGSPNWQNDLSYNSYPNVISKGKNNSFAFGRRQNGDRLDFVYEAKNVGAWLWKTTENVTYPAKGHAGLAITYIEVIDKKAQNSSEVTLLLGGVNWHNATFRVKSARNHGYHYQFNIYGKP